MNHKIQKNYGSWPSTMTTDGLASRGHRFGHLTVDNGTVYWLESLPNEAGRVVINCVDNSNPSKSITPDGFSVRTRVHEYGGADFSVRGETIIFCNDSDQRLYLQRGTDTPIPITPAPDFKHGLRYADIEFANNGEWLICIRERHAEDGDPLNVVNEIVRISLTNINVMAINEPEVLVNGADFYSYPRISPDGKTLAWTCWNHPNMPWDQTALWNADIDSSGYINNENCLLNNENESIYQPAWSPDGVLYFVSDRSGWWNIYSFGDDDVLNAITPLNAEFGFPQWQFGTSSYAFIDSQTIFAVYCQDGREHLCLIELDKGHMTPLELPYCSYQSGLYYAAGLLFFIAANKHKGPAVISWNLSNQLATTISQAKRMIMTEDNISVAEAIRFPTEDSKHAHGFFYPPLNSEYQGSIDEQPPLIVMSHGGPTAKTSAEFNANIQFWTNRGFAVVDVNYGGSTGFGRKYRDRLKANWGIVDVADCVNAAKYLVARGSVDGQRLAIRGGSAGGYTTYCALTNYSLFSAGVSRYGVADLSCLVKESHKFEVRYLDSLVGPWPEAEAIYYSRSPINHTDKFNCPVLLLQGDEDAVVPPAQSIAMAAALDQKQIPHALIILAGEQHGFRKRENICLALEAELNFYGQIFKLVPADKLFNLELKHKHNI